MADIPRSLDRLRRDPCGDLPIDQHVEQLLDTQEPQPLRRDRLLPIRVTFRLFLMQILHGNIAIAALRQLAGLDFAPSSYCEARGRLSLDLLQALMTWVGDKQGRMDTPRRRLGTATTSAGKLPRVSTFDSALHIRSGVPVPRTAGDRTRGAGCGGRCPPYADRVEAGLGAVTRRDDWSR